MKEATYDLLAQDLLFEIGVEELPPKPLKQMALALQQGFSDALQQRNLQFQTIHSFAAPRRLAVLVHGLQTQQHDYTQIKKGPSVKSAFSADGNPSKATLGFARSCNTEVGTLEEQDGYLIYQMNIRGRDAEELIPEICSEALKAIPIPKPMRWGNNEFAFVRPVHWCVLLLGDKMIRTEIFGIQSSNQTYGHRYHHPQAITLNKPSDYEDSLFKTGKVIADFEKRKELIREKLIQEAKSCQGTVVINEALLDEVCAINEWPVIFQGRFADNYLKVPAEALISAMEHHQKSFPVVDAQNVLKPIFLAVANIESSDPKTVIHGNERVINARLADAKFFYETDNKQRLDDRLETLKHIVFQASLGSLFDKAERIAKLASFIGKQIANNKLAERAGLLSKTDLVSDMVKEFPELQGIMGYYYALNDSEDKIVATAIREHYQPRFAGDTLPTHAVGDAVALADKLDTLVAIFGIKQYPTGDKDPFALRRCASGILRILIEHHYPLSLKQLLTEAVNGYTKPLANQNVIPEVCEFILDRLHALYQERGISSDTLAAVLSANTDNDVPLDIHERIIAIDAFRKVPEAKALAAANKRASNILAKSGITVDPMTLKNIDSSLFEEPAEENLYAALLKAQQKKDQFQTADYQALLKTLAELRTPIDKFFDEVMVMTDDEKIRMNRFSLLASLRALFLSVADISKLQES